MATPATSATGKARVVRSRCWVAAHGRGFSLIELMVVLAIITLVMASLPVALNRMLPARRVSVAADRLVSDIRWLQGQSAATSAPAVLAVLPSGYRLDVPARGQTRLVELSKSTTLRFRAAAEERAISELIVYPDGSASPGRFEIADSGRKAAVEISMLAGRVRRRR